MDDKKGEVRRAMGLAEPPDDELMALLAELGGEDALTGVPPVEGEGYTSEEIRAELGEAIASDSDGKRPTPDP